MSAVRKSLAFSLTERYLITALQLVSTMVLARLLSPHEIGVFSVATVFMGFVHVFRDLGIGTYLVQQTELTRDKIRTVAGAMFLTSWSLAPVVFLVAGPVAAFYREPGLRDVLHVLALNLLLIPFGATVQAWLHRHMRFASLLVIRLGTTITQVSTSITLAWLGHGFMSLAWSSVAGVVATVVLANCFRPQPMRVLPSFRNLGGVFRFGGKLISIGLLTDLRNGLPELVIGRTLGLGPVAIYTRAQGQVQLFWRMFGESIAAVGLPHFALLHREGKALQADYARGAHCVVGVVWPLFAFLGLFAEPVVRVLYGPQWLPSVALVPLMCFASALDMWLPLSHEALTATGRINQALGQAALFAALFAVALVVCSPYGLAAVVQATVGIMLIGILWRYRLLRGWALAPGVLLDLARSGLVVTAVAMVGPVLVRLVLGAAPAQPLAVLVLAGALAVPGWLLGLALTGHPLAYEAARALARVFPRAPVGWMLRRVVSGG